MLLTVERKLALAPDAQMSEPCTCPAAATDVLIVFEVDPAPAVPLTL